MDSAYAIGYFVGVIIWGIIWGVVAKAVVTNKGYEEKGTKYFWLGFFFSFIPVIVAATKPNLNAVPQSAGKASSSAYDDLEKLAKLKEQGVLTEEEYSKLKSDCLARM